MNGPASQPTLDIPSVEDSVYAALREEILHLSIPPGARLGLEALARRYGVSQTPVRIALTRLQGEGLVEALPRRGARVSLLDAAELEEIQAIRMGVEGWLARHGAVAVSASDLETMERHLEDIDDAYRRGDLDAYLASQHALRDVCYCAARIPRVLAVAREQRQRVERYLRTLCASVEAIRESREHQAELLAACRVGDGRRAEAATHAALVWTLERFTPQLAVLRRQRGGTHA